MNKLLIVLLFGLNGAAALAQGAVPFAQGGGNLAAGLYVHVIDGAINLSNRGGTQNFGAGQFGYVSNLAKPPALLPQSPNLKFTLPPTFSASIGTTATASKSNSSAVDCEVR